ncbi:MAG: DUF3179 domain-containing (seleno)protein [Planctomycetota bacterium]
MQALTLALAAFPQADVALEALLPNADPVERRAAFAEIAEEEDERYVAPLLDLLALADTREEWFLLLDTLTPLVGRDMRAVERPWRTLSTELARLPAPELPEDAWAFKGALYGQRIDAEFARFFGSEPGAALRVDQVAFGGVPVDGIPALNDPETTAAADAAWLDDDAAVVGLHLGGVARAYPLAIIDWHEFVNDVVGGTPVALSWCTLCGAAIPYRAERDGKRLLFGSSGLLHRSNKLMFDRGTDTLWDQLAGSPVAGPRVGEAPLERLPVRVTTWGAWRAAHPDTDVLSRRTGHERVYAEGAAYGDYFASAETMFAVAHAGADPKALVTVLYGKDGAVAVSVADVQRGPNGAMGLVVDGVRIELEAAPRPAASPEWRAALGDELRAATPDDLLGAYEESTKSERPLPPLSENDLLALFPRTRRALLDRPATSAPIEEGARARAASRALAADVRARATGEDGEEVAVPVHLAFRFAVAEKAIERGGRARAAAER